MARSAIGGGTCGEAQEHHPAQIDAMNLFQSMRGGIKAVLHVAGIGEFAVKFIGPLVIRADEFGRGARVLGAKPLAPVATDVMEGADHAVIAAHDDHGIGTDLQCDVAARLGQRGRRRGKQPFAVEDVFQIGGENAVIAIQIAFQRIARAAAARREWISDWVSIVPRGSAHPRADWVSGTEGMAGQTAAWPQHRRRPRPPRLRHSKAGFRAWKLALAGLCATPSQGAPPIPVANVAPVFPTVAGAAPELHRLPNSPPRKAAPCGVENRRSVLWARMNCDQWR